MVGVRASSQWSSPASVPGGVEWVAGKRESMGREAKGSGRRLGWLRRDGSARVKYRDFKNGCTGTLAIGLVLLLVADYVSRYMYVQGYMTNRCLFPIPHLALILLISPLSH
jgi:hypothetical protein